MSGSVSAQNGEVGILGGSFGQGTVPKGKDKVSRLCVVIVGEMDICRSDIFLIRVKFLVPRLNFCGY